MLRPHHHHTVTILLCRIAHPSSRPLTSLTVFPRIAFLACARPSPSTVPVGIRAVEGAQVDCIGRGVIWESQGQAGATKGSSTSKYGCKCELRMELCMELTFETILGSAELPPPTSKYSCKREIRAESVEGNDAIRSCICFVSETRGLYLGPCRALVR